MLHLTRGSTGVPSYLRTTMGSFHGSALLVPRSMDHEPSLPSNRALWSYEAVAAVLSQLPHVVDTYTVGSIMQSSFRLSMSRHLSMASLASQSSLLPVSQFTIASAFGLQLYDRRVLCLVISAPNDRGYVRPDCGWLRPHGRVFGNLACKPR